MHIFCDSSVNNQTKKAIGSYLILNDLYDNATSYNINFIQFDSTSSTIAELLTIKYVLSNLNTTFDKKQTILYTDCENFINLINKRRYNPNLENHRNYQLYKDLILLVKRFNTIVVWTKGHSKKEHKIETYQQIFSQVDKHARKTLRLLSK